MVASPKATAASVSARRSPAGSAMPYLPGRRPGPDPRHGGEERTDPEEPGHCPFGHRAGPADGQPAPVIRVPQVLDVTGDASHLLVGEHLRPEDRHLPGAGPHR